MPNPRRVSQLHREPDHQVPGKGILCALPFLDAPPNLHQQVLHPLDVSRAFAQILPNHLGPT